jgi:hypothetical protein
MEVLLIFVGIIILFAVISWVIEKVKSLVTFYRYLNKLKRLEPKIKKLNINDSEKQLEKLKSTAHIVFKKLEDSYMITNEKEEKSVKEYH